MEIRQAGESISCQCGVTLDIPKLRDLRQLEPVAEQTVARPRAGWSMLQGSLFVVGLCALVLSAGSAVFVWSYRQQFDTSKPDLTDIKFERDLDGLSLDDTWRLWKAYSQQEIELRPTPYHVMAKGKVAQLDRTLSFWGVLAAFGAIALLLSLVLRSRHKA